MYVCTPWDAYDLSRVNRAALAAHPSTRQTLPDAT